MDPKGLPRRPRRLSTIWVDDDHPCLFVTLCTAERKPALANDIVHARMLEFLESSKERYGWCPQRYVAMPDHIHILVRKGDGRTALGAWIKALKAVVAQKEFRWQAGFFDHVIRSGDSAEEKWEYVVQNPVRAGLVERPEDWRFGREIHTEDIGRNGLV
jgi:putative transposase